MTHRAEHAGIALAVVGLLGPASLAVAYRRVLGATVDHQRTRSNWASRAAGRTLVTLAATSPASRAIAMHVVATMARVERQRLTLAIALGCLVAWTFPVIVRWADSSLHPPTAPQVDLLTLPLALMVFLIAGVRVAAALPSDLKAAWVFDVQRPTPPELRRVMERLLLTIGVAPFILAFLPIHWWLWGPHVAISHAVFAVSVGVLLVELLLTGYRGVPCASPWRPERAQMRIWWPVYLFGFLWMAAGMPISLDPRSKLELAVIQFPAAAIALAGVFTGIALAIRRSAHRRLASEIETDLFDALDAPGVLKLN